MSSVSVSVYVLTCCGDKDTQNIAPCRILLHACSYAKCTDLNAATLCAVGFIVMTGWTVLLLMRCSRSLLLVTVSCCRAVSSLSHCRRWQQKWKYAPVCLCCDQMPNTPTYMWILFRSPPGRRLCIYYQSLFSPKRTVICMWHLHKRVCAVLQKWLWLTVVFANWPHD